MLWRSFSNAARGVAARSRGVDPLLRRRPALAAAIRSVHTWSTDERSGGACPISRSGDFLNVPARR